MKPALFELEKQMFIDLYGEDELKKLESVPAPERPQAETKKIETLRDKFDKENNKKSK